MLEEDLKFENYEGRIVFKRKDYVNAAFERCRDGENRTFRAGYNGGTFYIHSKYNPVKEAALFAEQAEFKKDSIVILFGFGLGYYVRELLKRFADKNILIAYELNNEVFSKVYDEGICEDIFSDRRVFVFSDGKQDYLKKILLKSMGMGFQRRIVTMCMPSYENIYINEYNQFLNIVRDVIMVRNIDVDTAYKNQMIWANNIMKNTPFVLSGYNMADFKDIFKGKPIIIVSAGPSLNKNIDSLKKVKGSIPIICVFVAAKALISKGIVPDIIISTDAIQKGMNDDYAGIPMAYVPVVSPEFVKAHSGKKIILTTLFEGYFPAIFKKFGKKLDFISSGGSVACTAAAFAVYMGAETVILMGQDLAYTNNMYHAEGTAHKKETMDSVDRPKLLVPDSSGGEVYTDQVMYSYIVWFEEYIDRINTHFVDATEGGALIKGTEVLSAEETFKKYGERTDVDAVLNSVFEKGVVFGESRISEVYNELDSQIKTFDSIFQIIDVAKEVFEKYIKSLKVRSDVKYILKLEKQLADLDLKLKKEIRRIDIYINIAKFITDAEKYSNDLKRESFDDDVMESAVKRKEKYCAMEKALKKIIEFKG